MDFEKPDNQGGGDDNNKEMIDDIGNELLAIEGVEKLPDRWGLYAEGEKKEILEKAKAGEISEALKEEAEGDGARSFMKEAV